MKRLISLLLCAVFLLMTGCSVKDPVASTTAAQMAPPTTVPTTTAPELPYDLLHENGQYCLSFNDSYAPISCCSYIDYPKRSSLEELLTAVLTADLSEMELRAIYNHFPKNEDGTIQVCNFDELYEPVVPAGLVLDYVMMFGEELKFEHGIERNNHFWLSMYLNDPEKYDRWFLEEYTDFLSYMNVILTEQTTTEDRNATVYYYESSTLRFRDELYILENGDEKLYVREHYRLGHTEAGLIHDKIFKSFDFSDTVPYCLYFFGSDDGIQFHGSIWYPPERPSVEFLLQLGVKPYVATETE